MADILNWLWQTSALALIVTAWLTVDRSASARRRYAMWWLALALSVLMLLWPSTWVGPFSEALHRAAPGLSAAAPVVPIARDVPWLLLGGLAIWLMWTTTCAARLLVGLWRLHRIKRTCTPLPETVAQRLVCWQRTRHQGRRTELAVSSEIRTAAVLGLGMPVIALSPALIASLSPDELDQVVAHEWSHVQRYDDWCRLLDTVLATFIGLHPAVAWMRWQLHIECEAACDARVVTLTGRVKQYATCLTRMAELAPSRARALPVPGASVRRSNLSRRVERLLQTRHRQTRLGGASAIVLGVAILCVSAGVLLVAGPVLIADAEAVAEGLGSVPAVRAALWAAPLPLEPLPAPAMPLSLRNRAPGGSRVAHRGATSDRQPSVLSPAAEPAVPFRDHEVVAADGVQVEESTATAPLEPSRTFLPVTPPALQSPTAARADITSTSHWQTAAQTVGSAARKAGVAHARFFSHLGTSVADTVRGSLNAHISRQSE